ncbi:MAG: GNAT family N-acetyltransferase [Rhizobiaceae bacterium]|nr:GNAT family N-acetyltransferase [Rhizobiaceae bacterium]
MIIRLLDNQDSAVTKAFLDKHIETSLFLRSNMEKVGLENQGNAYQGDYFGAFGDDELVGVIAHYWNGTVMMQSPDLTVLSQLYNEITLNMTRPVKAVVGDAEQGQYILKRLTIAEEKFALNAIDSLMSLDLNKLYIPRAKDNSLAMVDITERHFEILKKWTRAYEIEALGTPDDDQLIEKSIKTAHDLIDGDNCWILEADGVPVALSGFNAQLPEIVQVGPVWTPPEHRNKGYARHLVARTLEHARARGVQQSILFTDVPAAQKAYEAIGYREIGKFQLALLKEPISDLSGR